jgi:hypothetical protein
MAVLLGLLFISDDDVYVFLGNVRLSFKVLSVITQKTVLFAVHFVM